MSGGTKHDQDKPRLGLIDRTFLWGLARVLTFGAKKYAAHNWRKGIETDRLYDALLRHLTAWMDGEDLDVESGLPHLDHAACELMFLRWTVEHRSNLDNRWRPEPPKTDPAKVEVARAMMEARWSFNCAEHGVTVGYSPSAGVSPPHCEACTAKKTRSPLCPADCATCIQIGPVS